MQDEREIAREILSGQISVQDASRLRSSGAAAVVSPKSAPASPPPKPAAADVAQVKEKDPVVTNAPSTDRKFPCKNCGARLDFDPTQRALKCPYCGYVEEIAPSRAQVRENDYAQVLAKISTTTSVIAGRSQEVRCPGCGASVLLEDDVETDKCPFCATHLANAPRQSAQAQIQPECLLPFHLAQRDAVAAFNTWIASRWFAPSDLRQFANLGQLSGVYLPFWTYDSMTYTHYSGQRGDDYWETETYTAYENGKSVTRTRQVRRTRWTFVSGEVDHFFDDVLVSAAKSLPTPMVDKLDPWDLASLEDFRPEFLAGFKTERYTVSLSEGFTVAQQIMDGQIRTLCCQDIGGDHQTLSSVNTQHVGITFKHILLPVWLAVYRYQDKTYRILVNARTGEVVGDRPYSVWKIFFLSLAILVVVIIVGFLVANSR